MASPQILGSGEPEVISAGMEERANCHMRMPADRSSIAITPPPRLLKAVPNVELPASTPQPALSLVEFKQLL